MKEENHQAAAAFVAIIKNPTKKRGNEKLHDHVLAVKNVVVPLMILEEVTFDRVMHE